MIKLRYPVTNGAGSIAQIQSFLHQLIDELNFALENIETQASDAKTIAASAASVPEEKKAQTSFNAIKSLIIKSADIVEAYYEEITKRLEGVYVAQSAFGTFAEQTTLDIEATSKGITQLYEDLQQIITDSDEKYLNKTNARIETGILYYEDDGSPVFGLEIGQKTTDENGVEIFNNFARFTSNELSFFDNNGNKVAYVSDKKLYITHVEITGSLTLGGFVDTVLADKSVVTRWVVGGDE